MEYLFPILLFCLTLAIAFGVIWVKAHKTSTSVEKIDLLLNTVLERLDDTLQYEKSVDKLQDTIKRLQDIFIDKRARGAFGEMQLKQLVNDLIPFPFVDFQVTLPNGMRADCAILLPKPTGLLAIDAKFPLENYQKTVDPHAAPLERQASLKRFQQDLKKHIQDIAQKYISPPHTANGAILFIPSEAIFAHIHTEMRDLVEEALKRNVWLASPATLMGLLTAVGSLVRDVKQAEFSKEIKVLLGQLVIEFQKFQQKLESSQRHIEQCSNDLHQLGTLGQKIALRFNKIADADLEKESSNTENSY